MAEIQTLARPYAEAAFKLALEAADLAGWSRALVRMAAVAADDAVVVLIGHPRLTSAQLANLITDVVGELSVAQRNFLQVLADNERLNVLHSVAEQFEALRSAHEGLIDARISSAFPLSQAQLADVVAALEAKHGRKVKPTVAVDPELIGGISIRIGDEVFDASVRGKLAQLADALMN